MSNLLDRINSRMSLVEYELYLLRSINNLYSLEDNRRYMYERDRLYNRDDSIDSIFNSFFHRRPTQSNNYTGNLNSTNFRSDFRNTNINPDIRNTNINPDIRNTNINPDIRSNINTRNTNNRNIFSNILNNMIPDLVEVSIVDANGRPISSNTSLENLRSNTTIEVIEEDTNTLCAICRTDINAGAVVRKLNSCRHKFHINCIDQWFESNSTCPTCRSRVNIQQEHNV